MAETEKFLSFIPGPNGTPASEFGYTPVKDSSTLKLPASDCDIRLLRTRPEVVTALTDPRFSLAETNGTHAVTGVVFQGDKGLLRMDPPDVTSVRRDIGRSMSEKSIEKWNEPLTVAAKNLAKKIAASDEPVDLNESFSMPFLTAAIATTLGITTERAENLFALADRTLAIVKKPEDKTDCRAAWGELYDFCGDLITEKRAEPDGSVISHVVSALDKKGMNDDDILQATATIVNGFPTPLPVLTVSAIELMNRPETVAELHENPDKWPDAVSELLRYRAHFVTPAPRLAMEDVTIGDTHIKAGEVVLPSLHAAANDPSRTENPDTFDIDQKASRRIIFGAGPHFCPGAALTNQWVEIGLKELFKAAPNLHLTVPEVDLNWQEGALSFPSEVPVLPKKTL